MTTESSNLGFVDTYVISSEDESDTSASTRASNSTDAAQKRNIAVKRGMPVSQIQPPRSYESNKKHTGLIKDMLDGSKFLQDFNPENSRREKQKRFVISKAKPATKKNNNSMYDEQGKIRSTQADVCDCFDADCAGCHFPCESCGSQKCGVRCRVNRKWAFDTIEYDGKSKVERNPLTQPKIY